METVTSPTVTVTFSVDLELSYDPFRGKSPEQFAALVQDDLHDALMDLRPEVLSAFTSMVSIDSDN